MHRGLARGALALLRELITISRHVKPCLSSHGEGDFAAPGMSMHRGQAPGSLSFAPGANNHISTRQGDFVPSTSTGNVNATRTSSGSTGNVNAPHTSSGSKGMSMHRGQASGALSFAPGDMQFASEFVTSEMFHRGNDRKGSFFLLTLELRVFVELHIRVIFSCLIAGA